MMKTSNVVYETDINHKATVDVNNWAFLVMFTLVAIGIASTFAFVAGRSITQAQTVIEERSVIRQELARLEQLVETLPSGVAFVDVDTTLIIDCNEGFRQLTGRSSIELIGKSILTVIGDEHVLKHRQMLIENKEDTWNQYGIEVFRIPHAELQLPDGTTIECEIRVRGTRIDGRREWMVFIDPRIVRRPFPATH